MTSAYSLYAALDSLRSSLTRLRVLSCVSYAKISRGLPVSVTLTFTLVSGWITSVVNEDRNAWRA